MKKNLIAALAVMLAFIVSYPCSYAFETGDSLISLSEVSVTAIKERTAIDRVPMSATSISHAEIERNGIVNIGEASTMVPNLYIPSYGSRMTSSIYIRGIGARIDQPAVGLNIDNVPYLNKDNFDFDIPFIERIEVFRGPQTTLYGRNTMGGLISVYTLSPYTFQGLKGQVSYGSGNKWRLSDGFFKKFSNKLAASFTADYIHSDGFFRNEYTGKKLDKEESANLRIRVDHTPRTDLTISNVASLNYTDQGGYPYQEIATGKIAYNDPASYRRLGVTDGLTFTYSLPGVTLSSISSFQYINDDLHLDQDFTTKDYFTLRQNRHEWTFTQDFIVRGKKGKYSWLGGLFGFYKRGNMSAPVKFKDEGITDLMESAVPPPMKMVFDDRELYLNSTFRTPVGGAAVYHRSTLSLGKWNLSGDLRLDYENTRMDYNINASTGITMYRQQGPVLIELAKAKIEVDDSEKLSHSFLELMPKFTAEYNLKNISVYGSAAKGYKSGGYNTQMFSDILRQKMMSRTGGAEEYNVDEIISYRPERSWNFEVGSRFRFPAAKLGGSVALFLINLRNQQLTVFPEGTTTGRMMTNAGRTRSAGFEAALDYTPLKDLVFTATYGFTDARFREFVDGNDNYRGNVVPYAPRHTLYAAGDYTLRLAKDMSLSVHAGMKGTGKIYWDESNTVAQPFYALFDASVKFSYDDYSLTLRADNIFDRDYDVFYFVSVNNAFLQRGLPARVMGTISYSF